MSVTVSVILRRKGSDVFSVPPAVTVAEALAEMARHNIGALIVSADGQSLDGIVSERDIVRELARSGADTLGRSVADVMTAAVVTCNPDASVDDLMATMTSRRIRHVPIVEDDAICGVVSIGDVVKSRLDQLEMEAEALQAYVTGSGG